MCLHFSANNDVFGLSLVEVFRTSESEAKRTTWMGLHNAPGQQCNAIMAYVFLFANLAIIIVNYDGSLEKMLEVRPPSIHILRPSRKEALYLV